jgi:hypothetical protein
MAEIRADLVGDSRSLVRSIDKVGDALEEVVDELATAGKTGDRELDGLADKLGTVAKAAKEADAATERIGSTTKKATKEAATATTDFKDEAKQNFGEVASSFSGDMSAAVDLVQGTLGGLAASLGGPLGLALGAASIALGAVIASAQKDAEKAEELRITAVEAVQAAFEEGVDVTDFSTSIDQIIAKVQELEASKEGTGGRFFWEEDPSRLEEWTDALDVLEHNSSEVVDTLSATSDELRRTEKAYKRNKEAIDEEVDALQAKSDLDSGDLERLEALEDQSRAYEVLIKNVDATADAREAERDAAQRATDVGLDGLKKRLEAEEAATKAAEDAAQRRADIADEVAETATTMYDSIRDAAIDAATSEEGVFDLDRWLNLVAESKVQADAYKANIASMQLTPDQWTNFLGLPEETRAAIASTYAVADQGTKDRIVTALTDTGAEAGAGLAVSFDEATSGLEAEAEVTTGDVDTTKATADLKRVADAKYEATVKVRTDGTLAATSKAIDEVAARSRSATITARTDLTAADRQLRDYRPPTVYVPAVLVKPGTRQPL